MKLWDKIIKSENPLQQYKGKACIYPEPYKGKSEVVRWFFSRNNHCQVFFACSKKISDKIDAGSWADVNSDFTHFVEVVLMPYCIENTDWQRCCRYGIDYNKKVPKKTQEKFGVYYKEETGCEGTNCHCEPFGEGDFTYDVANESEFILSTPLT